ncbi:MAG: protoheme IX farnesyltransferase [Solirubrobacteraceae bacterium]
MASSGILESSLTASAQSRGQRATVRTYLAFVKPHIDVTFMLVAATGSVLAAGHAATTPLWRIVGIVVAVGLLSAGAECWTNLLDRNMDALMPRTARRALPSGQVSLRNASALGGLLTASGLAIAVTLGPLPVLFLGLALVNNVVIYSALTKRATPWSIVLGSLAGPLTLWAGYTTVAVPVSAPALLLGVMVAAWVPVHIWAIATLYRDDYATAGVPMAPVVWSRMALSVGSAGSALLMGTVATVGLVLLGGTAATVAGAVVGLASAAVAVAAALLPWRPRVAGPLVHWVTAYLLAVLLLAIILAA